MNSATGGKVNAGHGQCGFCSALTEVFRRLMCIGGSRRGSGESCYQELDSEETVGDFNRSSRAICSGILENLCLGPPANLNFPSLLRNLHFQCSQQPLDPDKKFTLNSVRIAHVM
ncbi:hypothetical protein RUM44_009319 [Polyplax serrata]|uniref:Uncharacterized protein n=1 Tax=Polyplax serrata TaxID=468196 RepID=A0ABR1ASC3_POLSC